MDDSRAGIAAEEQLKAMEEQLKEHSAKLYDTKRRLFEQKQLNADLQAQMAGYVETYNQMIHSTSWKVTRPLRKVMSKLRHQPLPGDPKDAKGCIPDRPDERLAYNAQSSANSILSQKFHALQPIPSLQLDIPTVGGRLNFVTDSIEAHMALGGVATALIVATEFARKRNIPLRLITRDTPVNPIDYTELMRINGIEPAKDVTFYTDYDRDESGEKPFKLDVSEKDIFFATSWWGAHAIRRTSKRKRFFYIIQEVETFFYPHGVDHMLCADMMEDENIDFIVNSGYLFDYFKTHTPNITQHGVYFEPAFPTALYHADDFSSKLKRKLFFYARPNNPRNLFLYGLNMLEKAIENGILDTNHWDIYCAGQDVPSLTFANGYQAINLGLLSWKKYGEFLRDTDLTLSLMYTPHPSYPPYDAACSGSVVLSNQCCNKLEFPPCDNVILSSLKPALFLDSFELAVALAQDTAQRQKNYKNSVIPRDWASSLAPVMNFMGEQTRDV